MDPLQSNRCYLGALTEAMTYASTLPQYGSRWLRPLPGLGAQHYDPRFQLRCIAEHSPLHITFTVEEDAEPFEIVPDRLDQAGSR